MFSSLKLLVLTALLCNHVLWAAESEVTQTEMAPSTTKDRSLENLISNLKLLKKNSSFCDGDESNADNFCQVVRQCRNSVDHSAACHLFSVQASPEVDDNNKSGRNRPSSAAVWGYGILCVTAISLTSVIGVSFVPLMSKSFYHNLLSSLIGLAVGSLSGSAIFHLIPSAFSLRDVSFYPNHSYLYIAIVIWAGVYLFFIIERFLKVFMEYKSRAEGGDFVGHSHNYQQPLPNSSGEIPTVVIVAGSMSRCPIVDEDDPSMPLNDDRTENGGCIGTNIPSKELYEQSKQAMRASFGHMERPDTHESRPTVEKVLQLESQNKGSKIATVAWMIIFGDGVHNFIDGLSIGAAFSDSILTGISVSVAVLCEEFPHELGDFAVLLNAGMTVRQAMVYNFLSACTCYLGLFLGIMLGELDMGSQYIFAAAGGMFLYIALVDMVPELNSTMDQASKVGVLNALLVFALQNIGILSGIISLFILAKFQDDIHIEL